MPSHPAGCNAQLPPARVVERRVVTIAAGNRDIGQSEPGLPDDQEARRDDPPFPNVPPGRHAGDPLKPSVKTAPARGQATDSRVDTGELLQVHVHTLQEAQRAGVDLAG